MQLGLLGEGNRISGVAVKCLSGSLIILSFIRLWTTRRTVQEDLLMFLVFFLVIFYSLQAMVTGHLTNFIPHYLFFIIPLFILCIITVLSDIMEKRMEMGSYIISSDTSSRN